MEDLFCNNVAQLWGFLESHFRASRHGGGKGGGRMSRVQPFKIGFLDLGESKEPWPKTSWARAAANPG